VIAVAPAHQLEQLVELTYGSPDPAPDASVEVDLSTRVIPTLRTDPAPPEGAPTGDDVEIDLQTRRIPAIGDRLGDLGSMTLVELDDARVERDPSQSGQHAVVLPRTTTVPFPPPRTLTLPSRPAPPPWRSPSAGQLGTGNMLAALPLPLPAAIAAIERATAPGDAIAAAMRYLSGRFAHAVLFTISEGAALAACGHGDQLTAEVIAATTVPLAAPSTIQAAHDTRRPATAGTEPAGAIQDRLARILGSPRTLAAVPIQVGART
jgi:hypothetical protein